MKKSVVVLIVAFLILVLALFLFIYFLEKSSKESFPEQGTGEQGKGSENNESGGIGNGVGAGGGSSGSSSGSNGGTSETAGQEKQLPADINTVECGFYFSEYGVCAGTCPEGSCISEGRSCYCRI